MKHAAKELFYIPVGIAAVFWGICCALFCREKTTEEHAAELANARHDARWP